MKKGTLSWLQWLVAELYCHWLQQDLELIFIWLTNIGQAWQLQFPAHGHGWRMWGLTFYYQAKNWLTLSHRDCRYMSLHLCPCPDSMDTSLILPQAVPSLITIKQLVNVFRGAWQPAEVLICLFRAGSDSSSTSWCLKHYANVFAVTVTTNPKTLPFDLFLRN